jgi:folate-dependent phosphoribosylglycinamide formyltransferase PurN
MFEEQQEAPFDLIVLGGYMRLVREPLIKAYRDKIINVHPADLAILDYILHRQSDFSAETRHMILNLAHNAGIDVTGSPMTRSCPVEADRRFVGEDAVYDAIKAGRLSTRSSVIMVDEYIDPSTGKSKADHGEILTQGADTYVDSGFLALSPQDRLQDLRSYVDGTKDTQGHQARQKERSDWPALTTALRLIADGRLALGTEKRFFGEWRNVYLKDDQGQWKPLPYEGLQVGER